MVYENGEFKAKFRRVVFKALRAIVKGILFYAAYFVLWMFLAPISWLASDFHQIIETFVMVYIVLMTFGEFTSGTVFKYLFDAAKALFIVSYLILSLEGGLFSTLYQNVRLVVDLRPFLTIVMVLSLLGFAKAIIQAINFMNEKQNFNR